jgi:hypothetical protein
MLADTRPLVNVPKTAVPSRLIVMTASGAMETAGSYKSQQHGLFTYFLLKGLNQSRTTFEQLFAFVHESVLREAHHQNREQNPQLDSSNPNIPL